jgi:hypothetical protein
MLKTKQPEDNKQGKYGFWKGVGRYAVPAIGGGAALGAYLYKHSDAIKSRKGKLQKGLGSANAGLQGAKSLGLNAAILSAPLMLRPTKHDTKQQRRTKKNALVAALGAGVLGGASVLVRGGSLSRVAGRAFRTAGIGALAGAGATSALNKAENSKRRSSLGVGYVAELAKQNGLKGNYSALKNANWDSVIGKNKKKATKKQVQYVGKSYVYNLAKQQGLSGNYKAVKNAVTDKYGRN